MHPCQSGEPSATLMNAAVSAVLTGAAGKGVSGPRRRSLRPLSAGACATRPLPSSAVSSEWPALSEPVRQPELTYIEWFRTHAARSRWLTWFITFYIHWWLLLVLGALIVHAPETFEELMLNASFLEVDPVDEMDPQSFEVELSSIIPRPEEESVEQSVAGELLSDIAETPAADLSTGSDDLPSGVLALAMSAAEGTTQPVAVPEMASPMTPRSAVTAGSFSVWTEPENPRPDEPYRIIIQIRLPQGTKVYPLTDLQGVVVGSDGYRKHIPGINRGVLPIEGGFVRYVVPVVSADRKVEDTILIRSKMLKEAQRLQIRF